MYGVLELLTAVCVVGALKTILFVVSAALILVDEGMRSVLGLSAKYARNFSTAIAFAPDLRPRPTLRGNAREG